MNALTEHDQRFDQIRVDMRAVCSALRALGGQITLIQWTTGATFVAILALMLHTTVAG